MKWILFFLIVTSDGVTESHSYFETQELCELAAEEIQLKYHTNAKAIVTSCTHADGDEVPIWRKQ
jgi:hypothetical protein